MKNVDLFKKFLGVGYFPKELPPPFTSSEMPEHVDSLISAWKGDGLSGPRTRCDIYTIPRYGRSRRRISIPNPVSHFYLAKCLCESWDDVSAHILKSGTTLFKTTASTLASRVFDPIDFDSIEARKNSVLSRCDRALMLDISRYYPTIYTHSVAWALHGKAWCKQNMHKKALNESLGQKLDDLVRRGQDGQSLGIPLGPDTSIVLAEIIGSAMDCQLETKLALSEDVAFRYTDDFFIGLRDGRTPERVMAAVAGVLSSFELEVASDKTKIVSAASRADPDWAIEISQFRMPAEKNRKKKALEYYFKKAFHLAQANPGQNVLSYCVSRSSAFDVDGDHWSTYEEFLLQCARANPTTVEVVTRILIDGSRAKMSTNSRWIGRLIEDLISANAPLDHHWEVCWLLFLARELGISLTEDLVNVCEKMESSAVSLLLLDLGSRELAQVGTLKHRIVRELTPASLKAGEWLAVYEGARHGWLGDAALKRVADDTHFAILSRLNVAFYHSKRTTQSIEKEKVRKGWTHYDLSYFRF